MSSKDIKVGSRVSLRSCHNTKDEKVEVGVVIHICLSDNDCDYDAYVAFFGESFLKAAPTEEPYILRYYVNSLELIDDAEVDGP